MRRGMVEVCVPGAHIGDAVALGTRGEIVARVRELDGDRALVWPSQSCTGLARGSSARIEVAGESLALGTCTLGAALDARGVAVRGRTICGPRVALRVLPKLPHERRAITYPLHTGIRTIDGLLAFGRGARIGVFGAPGCGKSTLLERIVASCSADAIVVALIGERGREAQRWFDAIDRRTTVVCATSDRSPAERVRAAEIALADATALAARGLHVVVLLDSLARLAAALREVAVATGEPAGRGGYPPSVFAELARFVEIAGNFASGSMTLVASVLDDGDERDPVSDAARSLLDGHIALSPSLAARGHFPAIDTLRSASRTMDAVVDAAHLQAAATVRSALALLERTEDARLLGIESTGAAARRAVAAEERLLAFLRQDCEPSAFGATRRELVALGASIV
jgi:ATP synthase in type III secretion protein N